MIRRLVGLPDPGLGSPLPTEHVSQYAQVYAQREGQERTIDPEVPLETVVEHFEAEADVFTKAGKGGAGLKAISADLIHSLNANTASATVALEVPLRRRRILSLYICL